MQLQWGEDKTEQKTTGRREQDEPLNGSRENRVKRGAELIGKPSANIKGGENKTVNKDFYIFFARPLKEHQAAVRAGCDSFLLDTD